ncbi:MAG TPA: zinc metalloprotease HtpX [Gammaproteobacteria bacterium]
MDAALAARHRWRNLAQTLLLVGGMALLLALSAELLFGAGVWPGVFAGVALALLFAPRVSPGWLLRLYAARRLPPRLAPELNAVVAELAGRADLPALPALYWVPSRALNAFAVGRPDDAAIAVTDGLLRALTLRELAGVLAHEVAHLRHDDLRLMMLADTVSRLTHLLSLLGRLLFLLSLPLLLVGLPLLSLGGLLLLVIAPTASALLQLALSRTREFSADLAAVELTGDPEGLASALARLEQAPDAWWQRVLFPGRREPNPSLLRTHPLTAERVERLLALRATRPRPVLLPGGLTLHPELRVEREPRRQPWFGVWR